MSRRRNPPTLTALLNQAVAGEKKPVAFVLAGHNGSGKSTLWNERLSKHLRIPLINADRLTLSILPERDPATQSLPSWAQDFRDNDERWQRPSQEGVRAFTALVMEQRLPFAFETVFSHWEKGPDGRHYSSKIEEIKNMQAAGYFVVLLFNLSRSVLLSGADALEVGRTRCSTEQDLWPLSADSSGYRSGLDPRGHDPHVRQQSRTRGGVLSRACAARQRDSL